MNPSRLMFVILIVLVAITGCTAVTMSTPAPPPTPTVPAVGDPSLYGLDLVSGHEKDWQLPDRPTRYDMTLTYDPTAPTLKGREDVLYYNHETVPLNEIYFRLFANYPGSGGRITIDTLSVQATPVQPTYETQNTAIKVPLAAPLSPGARVQIHLEYTVSVPKNSSGHYADFTADPTVTTLPTVYPLIPAYDSKGWHIELPPPYGDLVYADVSLYTVSLTAPGDMMVIASGSTIGTTQNGDGTKTWKIVGAPMRDFDINLTNQLQVASTTVGKTTVNSYYEALDAESGQNALKYASDALQDFETRFGDYPYKEFDVIETPTTAGGIEYPGVVVLGRTMYKNPRQASYFEFAAAHETAHQWWYAMVGDDQVNHPWVDEALAQYSALIYEEDVHGVTAEQTVLKDYIQNLYDIAKKAGHDAPVDQPVSAFSEQDYAAIVYGKGPLFYDAIRMKMGDTAFFKFLRTYFQRFRYKIAMPEDILKTAEDVYGGSLQSEYQQWITGP